MVRLFDYVFYRVYKFYQKRDSTPQIYASGVLTLMQFLCLINIMFIVQMFYDFAIPSKFAFAQGLIFLIAINWYRYERDFDFKELETLWAAETDDQKRQRGWLLVVSLISFILFPILVGILKHNLGVI